MYVYDAHVFMIEWLNQSMCAGGGGGKVQPIVPLGTVQSIVPLGTAQWSNHAPVGMAKHHHQTPTHATKNASTVGVRLKVTLD